MTRIYEERRPAPPGLILEGYLEDEEIGMLKSGKEAEVFVVRRRAPDRSCLLAAKRYRPITQRAFRNDAAYRAHRRLDGQVRLGERKGKPARGRATQLAMDKKTRYGLQVIERQWIAAEWAALVRLWDAGASVPYPVEQIEDGILMELIGDEEGVAPRLAAARVEPRLLPTLFDQIRETMRAMVRAGLIHGDLSAYNVLHWEGRVVVIDFPQSVPLLDSMYATELLHRDCVNVCSWFQRKGLGVDPEDLFVDLLDDVFRHQMEDTFLAKE